MWILDRGPFDESLWQNAVNTAVSRIGRLDILVDNAGIASSQSREDAPAKEWDRVTDVNAKGVFLGTKTAIPEMRRAGGGSIVNTSSISGMIGQHEIHPGYNASKGAVRLLTKATGIQYASEGIRVNSALPRPIATPIIEASRADPERYQNSINRTPMGRYGQTEYIFFGVLFLASDESSYMTGSELVINGGYTTQ